MATAVSTPRCWACCCSSPARSCSSAVSSRGAKSGSHWPALPEGVEFAINPLVIIATLILVSSSGVIQWGLWRIRKGDRRGLNRAFALTILMGLTFLAFQATDYVLLAA